MPKHSTNSEVIAFNGINYRRYPNGRYWSEQHYYRATPSDRKRGYSYLHADIWKSVNGPIPYGYVIHHVDGNTENNNISNLACITQKEHVAKHRGNPKRRTKEWYQARFAESQERSHQWQKTEEGKAAMREHGRRTIANRKPFECTCEQCGKVFTSIVLGKKIRFCSGKCDSKWRLDHGDFAEDRACAYCGKTFTVKNKWSSTKCCSRSCAQRSWRK